MDKIMGIVRHVVGGVGAALVGFGISDAETAGQIATQAEAIIGGVMFFAGIAASIYAKVKTVF